MREVRKGRGRGESSEGEEGVEEKRSGGEEREGRERGRGRERGKREREGEGEEEGENRWGWKEERREKTLLNILRLQTISTKLMLIAV